MTYKCPVCGFDELTEPPELFTICPCCATELGNTDYDRTHAELRAEWLASGASWWDPGRNPPPGWSADKQLRRAKLYENPSWPLIESLCTAVMILERHRYPGK